MALRRRTVARVIVHPPRWGGGAMSAGWWFVGLTVVLVLGAAIPLLKSREDQRTPLPPRKETLKDWRNPDQ